MSFQNLSAVILFSWSTKTEMFKSHFVSYKFRVRVMILRRKSVIKTKEVDGKT